MRFAPLGLLLAVVATLATGCHRERLTAQDCGRILDRITELELAARGFRDPALAARREAEMRSRLKGDLDACVGRRVSSDAVNCALAAPTTEDLSQRCLR